jgi:hypothetical protein
VERAVTLADYVPEDQEEKREILETAALFLPPVAAASRPPDAAARLAALARLEAGLAGGKGPPPGAPAAPPPAPDPLAASEARLREALRRFREGPGTGPSASALALLQANVVGTLPEQLEELARSLAPAPVAIGDLPAELRDQMIAPDGRARIQVFPRKDVSDSAALEEFLAAVEGVVPEVSGSAVSNVGWGRVTSGAMRQALGAGIACMFAFLFLLWRDLWDSVLAFFPLALASALSVAVMVLAGIDFNFANVIVLPMLVGMGIDNGVHLVHRHRTNPEEVDVLATSTARAVFFSAVVTVMCFGSLAFASHRGMAAIGQLLTLGVAATLVCYVVVLPAVLVWDDARARRRGRPGRRRGRPGSPPAHDGGRR